MSYTSVHKFTKENGYERVISKENSDLKWMGFERIVLNKGENITYNPRTEEESVLVIQEGAFKASCKYKEKVYFEDKCGQRSSVYEEKPYAIYAPPGSTVEITAVEDVEFRIFTTECKEGNEPYFLVPEEVAEGTPGVLNMKRKFRHLFGPAGKNKCDITKNLIVGESVSQPGGWVGFPAHRHDFDNAEEYPLDEIFSFKVKGPDGGYLLQHSYGYEDGEEKWHEVQVVNDDITALGLSEGYHTSMAVPGCVEYLLWGLGGETKTYNVKFDPRFDWLEKAEELFPQF